MTNPTPQDNPNLDRGTRLELRVIELERVLSLLQVGLSEGVHPSLDSLDIRVKELEEARKRQIALNGTFVTKDIHTTPSPQKKSIFDWFK